MPQADSVGTAETSKGRRAAQYVRMSTDHQRYSTENQADTIAGYATRRGFAIIRTYKDEGRSGLLLHGRDALQSLLTDVRSGRADFETILVYDISRWGRFQDADEHAYYEFICKQAGIKVHYCAEQFENDGSLFSTLYKNMKRAMAGEWSRDLSTKVFIGQSRIVTLGFFGGGFASYGLRREMLDESGNPKAILEHGQRKNLQTDRVILRPGPTAEIKLVNRIFSSFVVDNKLGTEIATELNAERIVSPYGKHWTVQTIHNLLQNERYLGHNVYNRTSFKLQQKHVVNPPEMWIRKDNAFQGIIAPEIFAKAQKILSKRRYRLSDQEALDRLAGLWRRKGRLSCAMIEKAKGLPSPSNYITRFGSLAVAYRLIGLEFKRRYYRAETSSHITAVIKEAVDAIVLYFERYGGSATFSDESRLLTINQSLKVSMRVARPISESHRGEQRYRLVKSACPSSDLTLVIRLDASKTKAHDYYLLPTDLLARSRDRQLRLCNRVFAERYRYENLGELSPTLTRKSPLNIAI